MWPALMRRPLVVRRLDRPLPRSVCWNNPRLGCAPSKAEAAAFGLDIAERVLLLVRRLLCCTSTQLRTWWLAEVDRRRHGLHVCVGALSVILPLPSLPSPAIAIVECPAQRWRLEIRSHFGYLIAAEISQRLRAWGEQPKAAPRKEIVHTLQCIVDSLTKGSRCIVLVEGQRTPLVCKWIRSQSPSCGSFSLRREFPGRSWSRQPGMIILLGPSRIISYDEPR